MEVHMLLLLKFALYYIIIVRTTAYFNNTPFTTFIKHQLWYNESVYIFLNAYTRKINKAISLKSFQFYSLFCQLYTLLIGSNRSINQILDRFFFLLNLIRIKFKVETMSLSGHFSFSFVLNVKIPISGFSS